MTSPLPKVIGRLKRLRVVRKCRDAVLHSGWMLDLCHKAYQERARSIVASRYLRGEGLEIGAAFSPLDVPRGVKVRYVDHKSREELAREYRDVAHKLVDVDLIDRSGTLSDVPDESVDFIIANHVIEHTTDPIHAIAQWLRVVKEGGVVFMCVPDKRFTFDSQRSVTSLEHLVRDHTEGPAVSSTSDAEDYLRHVCQVPADVLAVRAQAVIEQALECHFHVWTTSDFLELLVYCRRNLSFPFQIEFCHQHGMEAMLVLRKLSGESDPVGGLDA